MKKWLPSILLAAVVLIFIVWQFLPGSMSRFVNVISGDQVSNYQGGQPSHQESKNWVDFDLKKVSNTTLTDIRQIKFDARPSDRAYAFLDFNNYNKELRLINIKNQTVESFPFPEVPAYIVNYIWIKDQILLHYFSADGLTAGTGVNRDTPRQDHFYFFNPDTKKYISIKVDDETSKYTAHDYQVYFTKESDQGNNFAVSVCSGRDWLGECSRYGFSVSNGDSIKKVFDLDGYFTWGWKDGNFFVKNNGKVYVVSLTQVPW